MQHYDNRVDDEEKEDELFLKLLMLVLCLRTCSSYL